MDYFASESSGSDEYSFEIIAITGSKQAASDDQNYFCQQELASHFDKTSCLLFCMPISNSLLDSADLSICLALVY